MEGAWPVGQNTGCHARRDRAGPGRSAGAPPFSRYDRSAAPCAPACRRHPRESKLIRIANRFAAHCAAAVLVASALALATAPRPTLAQAAPVITAPVVLADDTLHITAIGSGEALRAANLQPAVAGEVAEVAFVAGDRVLEGTVLLRLVDRQQALAVELANSQVDAARRLLARYADTRDSGAVPASVVDDARTRLRDAEIALAQAREDLADRQLRAPFSGVVGITRVHEGDRVTPETLVTTIDDRRVIRVSFEVPEAWLGRLLVGQQVMAGTVAFPDREFPGRIAQIDSRVDPLTRNIRLLADLHNNEDLLRPGMSFEVRLTLAGERRLAIPQLAQQWGRDGSYVWAVRDGRAERLPVRSLRRVGDLVLVAGELEAGDTVVVEGAHRLYEGTEVRDILADGQATGGAGQ